MKEELRRQEVASVEKQDVEAIFTLIPELEKIGTREQYLSYSKKIFSESKVQKVLWHGSPNEKFESFDQERIGLLDGGYFGKGFYFSEEIDHAKSYRSKRNTAGSLYAVKVNILRPYIWKDNQKNFFNLDLGSFDEDRIFFNSDFDPEFEAELLKKYNSRYGTNFNQLNSDNIEFADQLARLSEVGTELLKEKGYDGSIARNPRSNKIEYVVFQSDQIHIFGSEPDKKEFADFIKNTKQ